MAVGEREEELHHKEAFEYYYALGKDRSIKAVSEHFSYSFNTVSHWSHWYGWRDRIRDRDNEIARRLAEEAINEAVKDRKTYLLLIKAMIGKGYEKFKLGDLVPSTVTDLINLMRLEMSMTDNTDDLTRRMTAQPPTITRELTFREVMTGGGEFPLDEELARRISEAIVANTAGPTEGDGGADIPSGMADGETRILKQLAPHSVVRDSGEREGEEGVRGGPEGPLQERDIRGKFAELEDAIYSESLDATFQPDGGPSERTAGPSGDGDSDVGPEFQPEPPQVEPEG
jgi:hypothetical protein